MEYVPKSAGTEATYLLLLAHIYRKFLGTRSNTTLVSLIKLAWSIQCTLLWLKLWYEPWWVQSLCCGSRPGLFSCSSAHRHGKNARILLIWYYQGGEEEKVSSCSCVIAPDRYRKGRSRRRRNRHHPNPWRSPRSCWTLEEEHCGICAADWFGVHRMSVPIDFREYEYE